MGSTVLEYVGAVYIALTVWKLVVVLYGFPHAAVTRAWYHESLAKAALDVVSSLVILVGITVLLWPFFLVKEKWSFFLPYDPNKISEESRRQ